MSHPSRRAALRTRTSRLLRRVPVSVFILAAAMLVSGGVVYASHDANTIHACASNRTGEMRKVNAASECTSKETYVQWGIVGPEGPAGADGQDGEDGTDGTDGQDGETLVGSACELPDSTSGTVAMDVAADGSITFTCDPGEGGGGGSNDVDADGVADNLDNCPTVSNPGQADGDEDGIGDACDLGNPDDVDGDGFTVGDGDCDDGNPAVNPGASEDPTDGFDTDCNGELASWPAYGFPSGAFFDATTGTWTAIGECRVGTQHEIPGGVSEIEGDIGPTAEIEDGLDNDCDGEVDEGF